LSPTNVRQWNAIESISGFENGLLINVTFSSTNRALRVRSAAAAAPAAFALLAENSDVMDADFMRFGAGAAPPGP